MSATQLTLYALDTYGSSSIVLVYINKVLTDNLQVGQKKTYKIQPGTITMQVAITTAGRVRVSAPIIVKDVKPGEHLTFYAGVGISPLQMAKEGGVRYLTGALFGGVFKLLLGHLSRNSPDHSVTFGQLKADEDIQPLLDLAQAQKRKRLTGCTVGFCGLAVAAFLMALLISIEAGADDRIASLAICGFGFLFLGFAYNVYREMPPADS